jgi:hypothetical protein
VATVPGSETYRATIGIATSSTPSAFNPNGGGTKLPPPTPKEKP